MESPDRKRKQIRTSLIRGTNRVMGICEKLRFIYDEIESLEKEKREKIIELLIDAMIMAKKMDYRLRYYKETYNDTTGHSGKNLEILTGVVAKRDFRAKRSV